MNTMRSLRFCLWTILLLTATGLHAQSSKKVSWKIVNQTITGAPGQTVELKVEATIASGWHMYSLKSYSDSVIGPQTTEITVGEKSILSINGKVKGPKPIVVYDEGFEMDIEYWTGRVSLTIPVKIGKKVGKAQGWVSFYYMTCDESTCLPASETKLSFDIDINAPSSKRRTSAR